MSDCVECGLPMSDSDAKLYMAHARCSPGRVNRIPRFDDPIWRVQGKHRQEGPCWNKNPGSGQRVTQRGPRGYARVFYDLMEFN